MLSGPARSITCRISAPLSPGPNREEGPTQAQSGGPLFLLLPVFPYSLSSAKLRNKPSALSSWERRWGGSVRQRRPPAPTEPRGLNTAPPLCSSPTCLTLSRTLRFSSLPAFFLPSLHGLKFLPAASLLLVNGCRTGNLLSSLIE